MAKYLISFPSAAMVVPEGEWEAVGRDAHAVIDEGESRRRLRLRRRHRRRRAARSRRSRRSSRRGRLPMGAPA